MFKGIKDIPLIYFASLAILMLVVLIFVALGSENQFSYLADSFLHGKTYFMEKPITWADSALYKSHYYWPLGPFPAFLCMPFVLFIGSKFPAGWIGLVLVITNIYLLYKVSGHFIKDSLTRYWLSFGFVFSTTLSFVSYFSGWSWYFAHVVTVTLLLLAILEFLNKRRYFFIGIFLGCAMATRLNLSLSAVFFLLAILQEKNTWQDKLKNLFLLSIPLFVTLVGLLFYNHIRFGSFFELGYSLQILPWFQAANRSAGLWSFVHFPANLYYIFLKGLDPVFYTGTHVLKLPFVKPDIWGTSLFITSPILLWLFRTDLKKPIMRNALLTALILLISILGYYGIGVRQYGSRYVIDLLPFLFLPLADVFKNGITNRVKLLLFGGFIFNLIMSIAAMSERLPPF